MTPFTTIVAWLNIDYSAFKYGHFTLQKMNITQALHKLCFISVRSDLTRRGLADPWKLAGE